MLDTKDELIIAELKKNARFEVVKEEI